MLGGNITISRCTSSHGGEDIRIQLEDNNSRVIFCELKMSLDDFARAITGRGCCPADMEVRDLDKVGKIMETKTLDFLLPECPIQDRKRVAADIAKRLCSGGWVPDTGFDSQRSFTYDDGRTTAHTICRRWGEPDA